MATVLLTGDVMLGRGIDQILPHPCEPRLYEPFVKSALTYLALAEAKCGAIPREVPYSYVWGDALEAFRRADVRIINLETALTCCGAPAPKGINYRCHPANLPCLAAAAVDCCVLANNHVLDWGEAGLIETLSALDAAGLKYAGAGRDVAQAEAPAILAMPEGGRILVYAFGSPTSGVPPNWAAASKRPGINLLDDHEAAVEYLAGCVACEKQPGDIAIVSVHWGPNWGYGVPEPDRLFAHRLIDVAGVDVVHGHSSHHPKEIELYREKLILYGCGDFINDYEGISGHEAYRPDLVLAYLVSLDAAGRCTALELLPFRIARFRLNQATREEAEWLRVTLGRESSPLGCRVRLDPRVSPNGAEEYSLKLST